MHITSFISRFNKQSKRTLIVCGSTMSNYTPLDLYGDGVPHRHVEDNNMLGMLLTEVALESKARWAKIEKRLAKTKIARDGCKAACAKEAMAKAAWEKAHGRAAELANGYLSIAELACDEKKKQKMTKVPMLTSPTGPSPTEKVLRCNPPWVYCTRPPSTGLEWPIS
jgi:hypothetical protein